MRGPSGSRDRGEDAGHHQHGEREALFVVVPGAARPTALLRRVGTCSCLNRVVDVEARPGLTIDGATVGFALD